MKNKHRIVLTGGPGGGKSTAADLIRRELGEQIVVVPEAATLLFKGGFPRSEQLSAMQSAQRSIYHVQKNMEEVQHSLFPGRVLLCDRGTIDGAAYWPIVSPNFFEEMNTSIEKELSRYHAVIFFETAAVGDISIEGGNPIRIETNTQAIQLDGQLKDIWAKHHHFIHIPHQKSFFKKLECALKEVSKIVSDLDCL